MRHTYDFFKPRLGSDYPEVDGTLSVQCYVSALDACYEAYLNKARQSGGEFDAELPC